MTPSTPPPPPGSLPPPPPDGAEARNWAVVAHVAGLAVGLVASPVLAFLGPLVVHLLRRDRDPFSAAHARAALNFQLTVLLGLVGLAVLAVPLVIVGILTLGIGLVVLAVLGIVATVLWFVVPILGALAANRGEAFDPPLTLTLVRGA